MGYHVISNSFHGLKLKMLKKLSLDDPLQDEKRKKLNQKLYFTDDSIIVHSKLKYNMYAWVYGPCLKPVSSYSLQIWGHNKIS